eukprot:gnl/MRDRNA2_/MRDRNA2_36344_c0_seq1.p1 gnl/MRDRNA2_/MRDRNA2_36344_c0~~gnl/MRDRNA2_/MRDRNA2_36344_c0_seq1.p1  ORF type:complete len:1014 (+),score=179.06 gnl/MRDRNA2_/MRDRNA2_36344_c0_seq1:163-3042(+)
MTDNLSDPSAAAVSSLVMHHSLPPSYAMYFLKQEQQAGNLTADQLYDRLLERCWKELEEDPPPGLYWDRAGQGLPPLKLEWSAVERTLFGPPPVEAVEDGEDTGVSRYREQHGMLRKGLPRPWFGQDAYHDESEEDEWGESLRTRKPVKPQNLPITDRKAEIIRLVRANQFVILQGETGCGKTTQVPQYILEMAEQDAENEPDRPIRVICTQPRRLAAITVAKRVADERGETIGCGAVGYKIRGETVAGTECKLLFCTTGVLLRRLIYEGRKWMFSPKTVTHLLIDEVHERSSDVDFLLTFLRDMAQTRPNIRVVLMSATLDTKTFSRYFSMSRAGRLHEPPIISVAGFCHPVAEVYLETVAMKCGYYKALQARSPGEVYTSGKNEDVDCQLIAQLVDEIYHAEDGPWNFCQSRELKDTYKHHWKSNPSEGENRGAALIFLPGVGEINELISALKMQRCAPYLWVLPLHASLPPDEQQICFETVFPQDLDFKVIVATNVAETSVTVPDITIVIDACRHRLNQMDKGSNTSTLRMRWCAQDSLRQRRGRAGRVQPGVCFRLILEQDVEKLDEVTQPEMQRVPLENLFLQACASGIHDVPTFLLRTPDPPNKTAITFAEATLRELGCLDDDSPDKLTALGRHLGAMPCHPRIGKMLVLAVLLGCTKEVLNIAGFLAARSPLITTPDARKGEWHANREALVKEVGFRSDHLVWALMLSDWETLNTGQRRQMAQKYGLIYERMNEALRERSLLGESLSTTGLVTKEFLKTLKTDARKTANWHLVVAAVTGGMYPQVISVERAGARCESSDPAERALGMRYQVLQKHHSQKESMSYPKPLHVHPNSICFGADEFHCPYMAFYASQQTTKLYAYDACETTPWALLLFGDDIVFDENTGHLVIGQWARIKAPSGGALRLISAMRDGLDKVLQKKLSDPKWNHETSRELMVIKKVLKTNGLGFEYKR